MSKSYKSGGIHELKSLDKRNSEHSMEQSVGASRTSDAQLMAKQESMTSSQRPRSRPSDKVAP